MIWRTKYGILIQLRTSSILHMVDPFTSSVNHHNLQVGHSAKLPSVPVGGDKFDRIKQQARPVYSSTCFTMSQVQETPQPEIESDSESNKDKDDKVHT